MPIALRSDPRVSQRGKEMNFRIEEGIVRLLSGLDDLVRKLVILVEKKIDGQDR